MIILGIDPGYAIVGYGVVSYDNRTFTPITYGAVTTVAGLDADLRLEQVYDGISAVIDRYQPDAIAIEQLFFTNNKTTGIMVAQARGVILLAARKKLWQGCQEAGHGDDPHSAAAGEDPQAGRCCRCPGDCHLSRSFGGLLYGTQPPGGGHCPQ